VDGRGNRAVRPQNDTLVVRELKVLKGGKDAVRPRPVSQALRGVLCGGASRGVRAEWVEDARKMGENGGATRTAFDHP